MSKKNGTRPQAAIGPTSLAILLVLAGCSNLETNRVQLPPRHHRIATSKLHEITTPDYHKPVEDEALPGAIE